MKEEIKKVEFEEMFVWKLLDGEADKLIDEIRDVAGYKEAKSAMYVLGACNIVEAAVRLGIVIPAENCGMIRDHKGNRDLHGAAYWQKAAEVAEARLDRVMSFIEYPYRDGELTPEQYRKISEALRAIIADD